MSIREKIRALRKYKGMTGDQMARRMGISRPFYTQLEGGKRRMTVEYVEQIAEILGVSVADLYEMPAPEKTSARQHVRRVNTPELREKLEPLFGDETGEIVECLQLLISGPKDLRKRLKAFYKEEM